MSNAAFIIIISNSVSSNVMIFALTPKSKLDLNQVVKFCLLLKSE